MSSADTATWGGVGKTRCGLAEFIAAEEMRRSRGYWWSPDGRRLLVARADTSAVDVWHIASPVSPADPPTEIRYPGAGTTNATVTLELHSLDGATVDVAWNPAGEWEYLADASWAPRAQPTLVVQPRDQRIGPAIWYRIPRVILVILVILLGIL